MNKFQRSWLLLRSSLSIIGRNKQLLIFPLVTFICTVMIAIFFDWIIALAAVGCLVDLFAWSYLTSVASQVYKGALYLYAAEGIIPEPYNREMLDMAWKFKKS